jgi:hypothetical protein
MYFLNLEEEMTKDERLTFLKQSFAVLTGLVDEINDKIANAKDGIS